MLKLSDLALRPDFQIGPMLVSPSRRLVEGPGGFVHVEPLIMQVLLGFTTEEIARHLQLSTPAVLTRLFRARQVLRKQLLGAADGEGAQHEAAGPAYSSRTSH